MNRRSFLTGMLKAGVASMILPSAATYARRWVKHDYLYLMGDWVEMEPIPWSKTTSLWFNLPIHDYLPREYRDYLQMLDNNFWKRTNAPSRIS